MARTFAIHLPVVTTVTPPVQYSDSSHVTVSATDVASAGSALTAVATGLPAGLSLSVDLDLGCGDAARVHARGPWPGSRPLRPGRIPSPSRSRTTKAASATTEFAIVVEPEDAEATYTGDTIVDSTGTLVLRAIVLDSPDGEPGDIRKATVTFTEAGAVICGPVAVELLLGAAARDGYRDLHRLASGGAHAIDVVVGGYYGGGGDGGVDVGTERRPRLGGRLLRGFERVGHPQGGRRLEDESRPQRHLQADARQPRRS